MATQNLTTTPTALSGLTDDTSYTLQFRSPNKSYVASLSATPTDTTNAFIVGTNGVVTVKKISANEVYVWSDRDVGKAVYFEAV